MTNDSESKRRGWVGSIAVRALLLVILIIPFMKFPIPPPGQKGILVSLGVPDQGDGQSMPETQNKEIVEPRPSTSEPRKDIVPVEEKKKTREASKPVVTTETPEQVAVKQNIDKEQLKKREEELKKQQEQEEARKRAEAEARKQAEYEASKKQFSTLLGGSGKGTTGTPGNQGDPGGDPNAKALDGISTGSGMVGGGLGNRGVVYEPRIKDTSQKTGTVVVDVCVDQNGDVVSAKYTQRGSNTTDSQLRDLAERSARQFKFTDSDIEKQCGTVTIVFKLQ